MILKLPNNEEAATILTHGFSMKPTNERRFINENNQA